MFFFFFFASETQRCDPRRWIRLDYGDNFMFHVECLIGIIEVIGLVELIEVIKVIEVIENLRLIELDQIDEKSNSSTPNRIEKKRKDEKGREGRRRERKSFFLGGGGVTAMRVRKILLSRLNTTRILGRKREREGIKKNKKGVWRWAWACGKGEWNEWDKAPVYFYARTFSVPVRFFLLFGRR